MKSSAIFSIILFFLFIANVTAQENDSKEESIGIEHLSEMTLEELMSLTVIEVDTNTDKNYLAQQVISGSRIAVNPMKYFVD